VHSEIIVDFFVQAVDGIRHRNVTGVQTCALPIFDIDPQGNATSGVGINKGDLEHCVYNVLVEDFSVDQVCTTTDTPNLDVVPATIQLAGAEIELVSASTREGKLKSAL